MGNTLGTVGEKFDLVIRRGATAGPFSATMRWADGTAFDLTGHTLRGHVAKRANQAVVATITASIVDANAGTYTFELTDEDSLKVAADPNPLLPNPAHYWVLEMATVAAPSATTFNPGANHGRNQRTRHRLHP